MDHVAIMKKEWGLTEKIIGGTKTMESRWYINKSTPWGKIHADDAVYFKDSGCPITIKTKVKKVLSFTSLTPQKVKDLLNKYYVSDGINKKDIDKFYTLFKDKNYCLLIFLSNVKRVKPFNINKKGFGAMSAWISVEKIDQLKSTNCPTNSLAKSL